jgi:hypothetical protein
MLWKWCAGARVRRTLWRGFAWGFAVALLVVVGCSRGPKHGSVSGTVTLDGKPLDVVEVVFAPDPERKTLGSPASCYTDSNGHYTLRTSQSGKDGVVVGFHRVLVRDVAAAAPAAGSGEDPTDPTLPAKVSVAPAARKKVVRTPLELLDVARTPLRGIEVKLGVQTLDIKIDANGNATVVPGAP